MDRGNWIVASGFDMRWTICSGDILDIPADVLICSANSFLNLSGGVGGALSLRYGPAMQHFLHDQLSKANRRWAAPGEVVVAPACGTPYKAVIHAVAVDAFYQSSVDLVRSVVASAMAEAATVGGASVALAALATGYGRMSMSDFGLAVQPLIAREWPPITAVTIGVRHDDEALQLRSILLDQPPLPNRG